MKSKKQKVKKKYAKPAVKILDLDLKLYNDSY